MTPGLKYLQEFANKHKIVLVTKGEVGFGRDCVGFTHGNNYIDINPINMTTFNYIHEYDKRLYCKDVEDAYHKHDCLAVLGTGVKALNQLYTWVKHLESQGEVVIERYSTGATGIQALVSGAINYHVRIK